MAKSNKYGTLGQNARDGESGAGWAKGDVSICPFSTGGSKEPVIKIRT